MKNLILRETLERAQNRFGTVHAIRGSRLELLILDPMRIRRLYKIRLEELLLCLQTNKDTFRSL